MPEEHINSYSETFVYRSERPEVAEKDEMSPEHVLQQKSNSDDDIGYSVEKGYDIFGADPDDDDERRRPEQNNRNNENNKENEDDGEDEDEENEDDREDEDEDYEGDDDDQKTDQMDKEKKSARDEL